VDVAVPVVIAAAMVVTAEHRAWPSRHRAYAGADHRPDRPADRRAGGGASEGSDGLCRRRARAEREAGQRNQGNLVHDPILPIFDAEKPYSSAIYSAIPLAALDHRVKFG
jgi:hypothetical protein